MNRSSWLIRFPVALLSAGLVTEVSPERVFAQSIVPAQDGTGTIVSPLGNTVDITGGTTAGSNLFHSFQQFGLEAGQTANFQATPSIANILGRVTGGSPSYINGLLQVSSSSANLYLMNPAGMVFGTNAQLNLAGSFSATTAAGIGFTGGMFAAFNNNTYESLLGAPNGFVFQDVGAIGSLANFGNLAVQPGQNLNLVAGTIVSPGTVSAPQGSVSLITLENSDRVRLSQTGMILGLDLPASVGVDRLSFSPVALPDLLTGGDVHNASKLVVSADGVSLEGSGVRIENGDLMAQEIHAGRVQVQGAGDVVFAPVKGDRPVAIVGTEDVKVRAGDIVTVRDSSTQSVQVISGGNLEITGLEAIDILALDHLNLGIPFQSGGDLTFISDGLISTDSHFFSGGNFSLLNTANSPASFFSLYDPIISSTGNVSFGPYTGTSLKVEAGGNISVVSLSSTAFIPGNIFITGPDVTLDNTGTDPDIPLLTGSASLILRAGVTSFSDSSLAVTTLPSVVEGINFNGTSPAGQGSITVQGSISGNQLANVILEATDSISVSDNITADAPQSRVVINAGNTSTVSTAAISGNEITISGGALSLGGTIAAGTGSLSLTGDEINWTNPVSGTGSLLLQPLTPGLSMELGGVILDPSAPDPFPLNLTAAELGTLVNGFTDITIGGTNSSGALTLAGNVVFADPVTLRSPSGFGSINTQGFNLTGDTAITLQAGGSIFIPTGTTLTSLAAPVDITLNSDRDGANDGAIVITDATIDSNGGTITMVGGTTGTGSAQGTRTNPDGVNITGSLVNAEGGNIRIQGEGFNSLADPIPNNRGVNLNNANIGTSSSGNVTIQGLGGTGQSNNDGVLMVGGSVNTNTGTITVTGTGGTSNIGGNYNRGVDLGGTIASTSGEITITGNGGVGVNTNEGVTISGGGSLTTSGNIAITGTGGTSGTNTPGDFNRGVTIAGGVDTSAGSGQITITGTGGSGVNNNAGVEISFGSTVTTAEGNITVSGTGSATSTGGLNRGINVPGSLISNAGGTINLTGIGGTGTTFNTGVDIADTGSLTVFNAGSIAVTGTAGSGTDNNDGVRVQGNLNALSTGGIILAGDSPTSTGTSNEAIEVTNTANLQATSTGSIALNSDRPQANQGAILVNTNLTTNGGNITSSAGGDVIVNGSIATTGGNVTMSSDGNITTQAIQTNQSTSAGSVDLTSNGNVTFANINTSVGNTGNGGNVTINANGDIKSTGSFSQVGTNIAIGTFTQTGSTTSNAGDISLTSTNGKIDLSTGDVNASAVNSNVGIIGNGGNVALTANSDIALQTVATVTNTGNGGNVSVTSNTGGINFRDVISDVRIDGTQSGKVDIKAFGDITNTATTGTPAFVSTGKGNAIAGDITIESTNGNVAISGDRIDANADNANAGNITISALGNITTTSAEAGSNNGNGGNIALTSQSGAIDTSAGVINTTVTNGNAGNITFQAANGIKIDKAAAASTSTGNGGLVSLTSTNGDIQANDIDTSANDNSGIISVTTTNSGNIAVGYLTSYTPNGNSGNITVQSQGNFSFLDRTLPGGGTLPTGLSTTQNGNISITSNTGSIDTIGGSIRTGADGSINIQSLNGNVTIGNLLTYLTSPGNAGNVSVQARGDINITKSIQTNSDSGNSGSIFLTSTNGNIITAVPSLITVTSTNGNSGNMTFTATGNIIVDVLQAQTTTGNAGNINFNAGGLINFGSINTRIRQTGLGKAGDINLQAVRDITSTSSTNIGGQDYTISAGNFGTGNGGNISLTSTGGGINVSSGKISTTTSNGTSGSVNFQAFGDIITGTGTTPNPAIATFINTGGTGTPNSITLTSTNGTINTSAGDIDAGGGAISFTAQNNITTSGIFSRALNGGTIALTSNSGAIDTTAGDLTTTTFSNGTGGSIKLLANNNITTRGVFATGTNGLINITSTNGGINTSLSDLSTFGSNTNLTLKAFQNIVTKNVLAPGDGSTISITSTNGTVDTSLGTVQGGINASQAGSGGTLTIKSAGDILAGTINTPNLSSSLGNAGSIFLTSDTGSISFTAISARRANGDGNGGAINLQANGNITSTGVATLDGVPSIYSLISGITGTTSGNGGSISLTSTNGSIDTRSGQVMTAGKTNNSSSGTSGNITMQAQGNITANTLNASGAIGGNVTLNSSGGTITTQGIQTDSFSGTAGSVTLTAAQNVNTANIDASALNPTGSGGAVRLQAGDQITVGDIRTRALGTGNAGAINLIATNSITAGNLAATSQRGAGGNIFLDPIGNITLATADATGGTTGGNITLISTGGNVLAKALLSSASTTSEIRSVSTLPLCDGSSLCTNGSGQIFIRHGILTPYDANAFRIGDPLLNGTAGAIVTGVGTLRNFNIPNQPGTVTAVNVSVTPGGFPEVPREPEVSQNPTPDRLEQVEERIVAGCPPECDFQDTEGTPPAPLDISYNLLVESIQAADERYGQEFTSYFGLTGRPLPTLQQLQQDLHAVEKDTGIKPAILFAILAPPTNEPTDPLKAVPAPPQPQEPSSMPNSRLSGVRVVSPSTSPVGPPAVSGLHRGQPDDELEIVVITPNGTPIRRRVSGVTRSQMVAATGLLRQEVANPGNTDTDRYLTISQRLYNWMIRPVEAELQARNIESIAFVLEPGMRSLPIATLYDGNQFIIEKYSVGLMPNLSLTDTRYRDIRDFALLGMGASTFTNQSPLPTVPVEVNTLTQKIWPSGEEYLNDQFTVAELKKQSDRFGVIHLATHADFVQGTPEGSYVQLSDGRLNLTQLRELSWATRNTDANPPVELLTLSACRTAVGIAEDNPDAIIGSELGFAGVAFAAGVKTSLASLWYVSDAATAALMMEFYQTLAQMDVYRSGILTPELKPNNISPLKAEALRQTQIALLRGDIQIQGEILEGLKGSVNSLPLPPESITALGNDRTFTHPYYWAAFTLIGNPW